ncbi:Bifunctional aspartate aminotransferase and L-aspartate beta-decarboxylase [Lactobacillus helveticus]|uniref:Aminotransferase n=1 Tax=Lactobacillus helveticus CIRM-BIA 953 TaxID=1226335 RepID=U4QB58_LACHE|nr:Aminotransferase class I and II [Lactobacillus helveticus H10]NRN73506.1 Bifunctional aspartate aminotransferase and L-aspartate beta-decarboxylase [Lactobacillus helveticus]CDI41697.1 L-aspartate-beta-decarboxylase [Lactobacillus helveticus CIRM-BIA 953]NRN83787.1 Bifunctional aspartate aminotransferase and L-aspartate beta-decarboxylase [Lactobacillus helveticus]NRO29533.1 Bifunctional aspartate aminotransferase and L-aspartate beta-decarboxylase [Lactobacillus helveticus]
MANKTELFPTEGGTAAIVYAFHSLSENHLLKPGDKIAINTPIFTPYLQIPELNGYELVEVDLRSREKYNWEIKPSELKKLEDPSIKALFVVNPTNPTSKAFNHKALTAIKHAVEKNPELMIITDDVYGTFVQDFKTIYSVAPHNTMLVYSFSKLYGATGWRLGLIALNKENVFDKKIAELDSANKDELHKRYEHVVIDPDKMKFIDRLVADSRAVVLYHTSGLSTQQQMMEVLFALTHLVYADGSTDAYIDKSRALVSDRYEKLHKSMGAKEDESRTSAKYYSLIDIYRIAEKKYGKAFREYLEDNFEQVDFLLKLARKNGVVLMDGVGFGSKAGELRVSEANLPTDDYALIGKQVLELLKKYHNDFESQNK